MQVHPNAMAAIAAAVAAQAKQGAQNELTQARRTALSRRRRNGRRAG